MKKWFMELPVWVRWGVVPVLAVLLFGSVIMSAIGLIIGLLFKVLLFVGIVAVIGAVVKHYSART